MDYYYLTHSGGGKKRSGHLDSRYLGEGHCTAEKCDSVGRYVFHQILIVKVHTKLIDHPSLAAMATVNLHWVILS